MLYYTVVVLIGAIVSAAAGICQLAVDATKMAAWFFGIFGLLLAAALALQWTAGGSVAV